MKDKDVRRVSLMLVKIRSHIKPNGTPDKILYKQLKKWGI